MNIILSHPQEVNAKKLFIDFEKELPRGKEEVPYGDLLDLFMERAYAVTRPIIESLTYIKDHTTLQIQSKFLPEATLKEQNIDVVFLAHKLHSFVFQKAKIYEMEREVNKIKKKKHLCLPLESLEGIQCMAKKLSGLSGASWNSFKASYEKNKKPLEPSDFLEAHADFSKFVDKFNQNPGKRNSLKEKAHAILNSLRAVTWKMHNEVRIIPDISKLAMARNALIQMFQCQDDEIKESALRDLIDLLESDPIDMKTAYDLADVLSKLLEEISSDRAQKLNIRQQRLLIKAYATTIECILLHSNSQNLNALEDQIKLNLWDTADQFKSYNISNDKEIDLWANYAVQGAQRIKTEVPEWKKWVPRIMAIGNAIVQIASLIQDPENIGTVISDIVDEFSEAFSHFEWHKAWFEELMMLRRVTRISLLDLEAFRKVRNIFQLKMKGSTNEKLLFGAISTLEYAIKNSPSRFIQEECLKLLLQYITVDSPVIRFRISQGLTEILTYSSEPLRNTAFILLRLLKETRYIPDEKVWQEVNKSEAFIALKNNESAERKRSLAENNFTGVIKFLIRRIGNIKGEIDTGGHSLTTLISSSPNQRVVTPLLTCLSKISPDFNKQDVYGQTPFHLGVQSKNLVLIQNAHTVIGDQIDLKDYNEGDTAIHMAAKEGFPEGIKLLLSLGANPNVENCKGDTPLHIAVAKKSNVGTELLLKSHAAIDNINIFGETPLNIALKNDDVLLVKLLMQHGAKIAEHVNLITPIIYAAWNGAEESLIHLIENKAEGISPLEAMEINIMMTKEGEAINAGKKKFCLYHLEKMEKSPEYRKAFRPVRNLPSITLGEDQELVMTETRSYRIGLPVNCGSSSSDSPKDEVIDDFNNTELMILAKNGAKHKHFTEALAKIKRVNKANRYGLTALHVAALYGNIKAVKELLKVEEIAKESRDIRGFTPLHMAAVARNVTMMSLLLDNGADPNAKNDYGDTPFLIFCGNNPARYPQSFRSIRNGPDLIIPVADSVENLEILIQKGAAYDAIDSLGNNAMHHAVCNGMETVIEYLFKKFRALSWHRNKKGLLPIEEAFLNDRHIDVPNLLKGEPLKNLHKNFVDHSQNLLTLSNLLAYNNTCGPLHQLFQEDPSTATHADASPYRKTPLHVAAMEGHVDVLQLFFGLNLPVHTRAAFDNTPLHLACLYGQEDFVKAMIAKGSDLTLKNQDGRHGLHLAASKNNPFIVQLLSAFPGLLRGKDGNGNLPLHLACKFNKKKNAKILYAAYPAGIHEQDDDLNTPLHHACSSGNLEIVRYLIQKGAFIESVNITGDTPLSIAVLYGHLGIVKYLIAQGADISARDIEKGTPLHKASYLNYPEIARALLKKDKQLIREKKAALCNLEDVDGETPLMQIAKLQEDISNTKRYRTETMRVLFTYGADPSHKNAQGETFFHYLAYYGHEDTLQAFMDSFRKRVGKRRFKPKDKDNKNENMLHKAAEGNRIESLDWLVQHRASLRAKNDLHETPLFTAVKMGNLKAAARLINLGSRRGTKNAMNQTILHALLDKNEFGENEALFFKWVVSQKPKLLYRKDSAKKTVLHVAAERNHVAAVDLILKCLPGNLKKMKKYLLKKTAADITAQQIAKDLHHDAVEQKLRNYPVRKLGAKVSQSDDLDYIPRE